MCGFMGAVGPGGDVARGLPWLSRRGPDSHRVWSSADGNVSLLHCRLAIVDTDPRANQPFSDSNHGITVALNGEIYNYRQLKREFADYSFKPRRTPKSSLRHMWRTAWMGSDGSTVCLRSSSSTRGDDECCLYGTRSARNLCSCDAAGTVFYSARLFCLWLPAAEAWRSIPT